LIARATVAVWIAAAFAVALAACEPDVGEDAPPTGPPTSATSATATAPPSPTTAVAAGLDPARVIDVIDGDTIVIEGGERVRYIGIDTPESTNQQQCFGDEAAERNRELVAGRMVGLERDVSERDRFGRLLRYVYVGDVFVNELLVRDGYAAPSTFPPDVKYQERFRAAERAARDRAAGLWGACVEESAGTCDPAYPDVCIPPPPPDLQCSEVAFTNFLVLPPDPHNFDGNGDGRGCEGAR